MQTPATEKPIYHKKIHIQLLACNVVANVANVLLYLQAYPEYLITYQILKPESAAQSAAGAEQKS